MQINGVEFTIGADPEIFASLGGSFKSAHDLIPGSKHDPFPVNKGAVQVDGMALEFNIDPAHNYEEFESNLDIVQEQLKGMIGDCEFMRTPSVSFSKELFSEVPPENRELGCDPDFNAWSMKQTRRPSANTLMRTAGGHVHVGGFNTEDIYNKGHLRSSGRLARILDERVGVYSVLWDTDDKRRSMYGKAGAFRPKKYGMEYRSLSNLWIFNKNLVRFVYDGVSEAIELMFDRNYEPDPVVRDIIDNSDRSHNFLTNTTAQKLKGLLA